MLDNLSFAIEIAARAHRDQFDKAGVPYILHALAVMNKIGSSKTLQIIAVLHDVIEDSDVTLDDLSKNFSGPIIFALDALTRRNGESYDDYICRVEDNQLAIHIKIADLEHNMDVLRLLEVNGDETKRIRKYHKIWLRLKKARNLRIKDI